MPDLQLLLFEKIELTRKLKYGYLKKVPVYFGTFVKGLFTLPCEANQKLAIPLSEYPLKTGEKKTYPAVPEISFNWSVTNAIFSIETQRQIGHFSKV